MTQKYKKAAKLVKVWIAKNDRLKGIKFDIDTIDILPSFSTEKLCSKYQKFTLPETNFERLERLSGEGWSVVPVLITEIKK